MRACAVGEVAHAAQEVAVRHPGRGDDHVAGSEVLGPEHAAVVVDSELAQLVDLAPRRRPELRLQLAAEAAQRGGREYRLPRTADADRGARHEAAGFLGRAEDDAPPDRELVERRAHAGGRRLLGSLLVGAAEPARRRERGALGRSQVRLALTRLRVSVRLFDDRLELGVGHTRSRIVRSAAESTSSATARVARSALEFSITATPSRCARSTISSCRRLMSWKRSRYLSIRRSVPASREKKCCACAVSSSIFSTHALTSAPSSSTGRSPGTRCTPSSTIDQPSCNARSSDARTPTRTLRDWSRKPVTKGSSASGTPSPASKLE